MTINKDDIIKDIEKRAASSVEIIQITESMTEQFILFSNKTSGQLGMIYYKPHSLITNRYEILGGSNIAGNTDLYHKYGVHNFGQGIEKGYERLIVVYGRNEPNAKELELDFGDNRLTKNIEGKDYFLEIFRFTQEKFSSQKVRFFDKANQDITQKFQ